MDGPLSIIIILFMKYQMVNGQSISLIHLYWWSHQSSQFFFEIAIIAFVVGGGLQKTKLCNIGRSRNCWPLHALVLCLLRPLPLKCLSVVLKINLFPKTFNFFNMKSIPQNAWKSMMFTEHQCFGFCNISHCFEQSSARISWMWMLKISLEEKNNFTFLQTTF